MKARGAAGGLAMASLALLVAVGCGSGAGFPAENVWEGGTGIAQSTLVPSRVTVQRPGFIDNNIPIGEVPVWPGPDPSEFLQPSPPSGESGELTGDNAAAAYSAALANPDALWNVGGIVYWLVVGAPPTSGLHP